MNSCPGPENLSALIDERLSAADCETISIHVETCSDCQLVLAELTSSAEAHQRIQTADGDLDLDTPDEVKKRLSDRLRNSFQKKNRGIANKLNGEPSKVETLENGDNEFGVESACLGDYRLIHEIGRGGMGVVFKAEQISLGRTIALKVLSKTNFPNESATERFKRESRAAASLHHTNIVPVHDSGFQDGTWFYTMQLIDGASLDTVSDWMETRSNCSRQVQTGKQRELEPSFDIEGSNSGTTCERHAALNRLPIPKKAFTKEHFTFVADVGIQAAQALQHAHERRVIHRDVKPSNLIIDPNGIVWLTDFGLAKTQDELLTATTQAPGTLRYMSPERFDGKVEPRCDVYSLGVTLYELLSLSNVFDASNQLSLLKQIQDSTPTFPLELRASIPVDLQTIILKAMEKQPERRYETAREMQNDLQRYLSGQPIKARKIGPLARLSLWARRNQALAAATFLIAALLLVGSITSTIAAFQFRSQSSANLRLATEKTELAAAKQVETNKAIEQRDSAYRNAYFADMRQTHQDWEDGQTLRMLTTLRNYVPKFPNQDIRGWEWYYLLSLAHQDKATITDFDGVVERVHWSRKDRLIGSGDSWFRIWDGNGKLIKHIQTGKLLHSVVSPDGLEFATISGDSKVRIWSTESGKLLRISTIDGGRITCLDWNQQGDRISLYVRFPEHAELILLAPKDGKIVERQRVDAGKCLAVKFSPDGKYILHAKKGGFFDVLETRPLVRVGRLDRAKNFGFQAMDVAWHPDSRRYAVGCFQQGVRIFEVNAEGKEPTVVSHLQYYSSVDAIDFSADGNFIAVGDRSQNVSVYDLESNQTLHRKLKGHLRSILSVSYHPENQIIASSSRDGSIKIWDPNFSTASEVAPAVEKPIHRYKFGGQNYGIIVRKDLQTGEKRRFRGHGKYAPSLFVVASPDGTKVASCSYGEVKIWDAESCQEIASFFGHRPGGWMPALCWSHSGRYVASGSADQTVRIWDVEEKKCCQILRGLQSTPVTHHFGFSADDARFSTWDSGNRRVWDVATGREILTFDIDAPDTRFETFHRPVSKESLGLTDSMVDFEALKKMEKISEDSSRVREYEHQVHYELAKSLMLHPLDPSFDPQRGSRFASLALQLDPGNIDYLFLRSLAHFFNDEYQLAVEKVNLAIDSGLSRKTLGFLLKAICLKRLKQDDTAAEVFAQAVREYENAEEIEKEYFWFVDMVAGEFIRSQHELKENLKVDTLADEIDGLSNGKLSLREALHLVQAGGTIEIKLEGILKPKIGQFEIGKSMKLVGAGADKLVIDADRRSRILRIDDLDSNNMIDVEISGMTLANGQTGYLSLDGSSTKGAGIYLTESLRCSKVDFKRNQTVNSPGGALVVLGGGKADLYSCNFIENSSTSGGAIRSITGNLFIDSCLFFNNSSRSYAGGAVASAAKLTIHNSTFASNVTRQTRSAVSGTYRYCEIKNCTFSGNSGVGLELTSYGEGGSPATIANCIFFGNSTRDKTSPDFKVAQDAESIVSNSIIGKFEGRFFKGENNQLGADPKLGPLSDNGGPTKTFGLLDDSPAIDAGAASDLKFDQRGEPFKRSQDGNKNGRSIPDIGAFEKQD